MRENCTSGEVRGASGNGRSYRGGHESRMDIRKLKQTDIERVRELLAGYDLPIDDLEYSSQEDFWVAEEKGHVIGVGGMDHNNHIGLVRSLALDKQFQGNGIGKRLYEVVEEDAWNKGILRLYILTTTAQIYFEKLGYEAIERDIAPIPIQQSNQFSSLCPQSAVLLQKALNKVQGRNEFDSGLFCAESVLAVVAMQYEIQSDLIPGIATGLCSGMGRTCGTCGAVTGGVLAVNLLHGRKSTDDSVERNYGAVQELVNSFTELYGTTNCSDLLGCDLGSDSGQSTFNNQQLHRRCREFTGIAADLAIKVIENAKKKH